MWYLNHHSSTSSPRPARFSRLRLSRPYHLRGRPRRRWCFSQLRLRVALQGHRLGLGRLSLQHLALQALGRRCFGGGRLVKVGRHGVTGYGANLEMAENIWMITGVNIYLLVGVPCCIGVSWKWIGRGKMGSDLMNGYTNDEVWKMVWKRDALCFLLQKLAGGS